MKKVNDKKAIKKDPGHISKQISLKATELFVDAPKLRPKTIVKIL